MSFPEIETYTEPCAGSSDGLAGQSYVSPNSIPGSLRSETVNTDCFLGNGKIDNRLDNRGELKNKRRRSLVGYFGPGEWGKSIGVCSVTKGAELGKIGLDARFINRFVVQH